MDIISVWPLIFVTTKAWLLQRDKTHYGNSNNYQNKFIQKPKRATQNSLYLIKYYVIFKLDVGGFFNSNRAMIRVEMNE